MYHCKVDMREDSHLFPSEVILPTILKGNFMRAVLYEKERPNDHHRVQEDEEEVDARASYRWGYRQLLKIWDKVIPQWKESGRKLGTHTGKKTGVAMYVTAGQESLDRNGRVFNHELDYDALAETFRFCPEICRKYYLRK